MSAASTMSLTIVGKNEFQVVIDDNEPISKIVSANKRAPKTYFNFEELLDIAGTIGKSEAIKTMFPKKREALVKVMYEGEGKPKRSDLVAELLKIMAAWDSKCGDNCDRPLSREFEKDSKYTRLLKMIQDSKDEAASLRLNCNNGNSGGPPRGTPGYTLG